MPVDYSQFLNPTPVTPEPTPSPVPAPTPAPVDYSKFVTSGPSAAHTSFMDALQGQNIPNPSGVAPVAAGPDPLEAAWQQELAERQRDELEPGGDGGPRPARQGGRIPWATFEEFKAAEQRRATQTAEAPLSVNPVRPNIGMGGAFATDLSQGVQRLGSMVARGQLAPDHAMEQRFQDEASQFAPRTFGEKVTGGLGGSVPALATIAATRGRAMPAVTGSMAVPLEVGGASFVQGMADPNKTPQQNISSALIETLMTRAGGAFEPGFGTPAAQLPAQLAKEGVEEGATGGLQNLSDQVNDPAAVASGAPIDYSQFLEASAVGAASGSLAAGAMSPIGMLQGRPAAPAPSPVQEAPIPEELAQTQTDLRPVDVQAIESDLAQDAGIPQWVDDATRQEIRARFRPDERGQIPGLEVQDFNDPDHLARLQGEVREYLDKAKSESDIDTYNAVTSTLNEVPDAPKRKVMPRITGRPNEAQDDLSIQDVGNSEDVEAVETQERNAQATVAEPQLPDPLNDSALRRADERPYFPEDQNAPNIKGEFRDPSQSGIQEGRIVIPAKQEPYGVRDVAIKPGTPRTPTTELKKFLSPKGVVAYNSMTDLERATPEVSSTLEAIKRNPDPNGDAANLVMARDIARNKRMKPAAAKPARNIETRPEPKESFDIDEANAAEEAAMGRAAWKTYQRNGGISQEPVSQEQLDSMSDEDAQALGDAMSQNAKEVQQKADFEKSMGPYKSPEPASAPAEKPQVRGTFKGARMARELLGPALATPAKLPSGFEEVDANVFEDAGKHRVHVKSAGDGKHFVAWDSVRGKALVMVKTDEKGRANPEGSQYRPVGQDGKPATLVKGHSVPVFDSLEDAAKHIAKNFTISKPAAEPIAQGVQDAAVEDAEPDLDNEEPVAKPTVTSVSRAARKAELTKKMKSGDLTDEEIDELEELEKVQLAPKSAASKPQEPGFKKVPNSPLTPRAREDIADSIVEDMPGAAVGRMVQNVLTSELNRKPSREEMTAALRDLIENGIITPEQSVIPGSDVTARAIGPQDLINLVGAVFPKAATDMLSNSIQDLTETQQLAVDQNDALKPGAYGYSSRKVAKAIVRALSPFGIKGNSFVEAFTRLGHLMGARAIAARFPAFRPVLSVAQQSIDNQRIAFNNAYHRLDSLRELEGQDKLRVTGALIQFRLEDRKAKDFDKPVKYEDERGRVHQYTLTPEQISVVKDVYRANKILLRGYVRTLLRVLDLPPRTTSKALEVAIAAGTVSPAAKAVLVPLRILEENADNYIPLKRFGDYMRATVMGPSINGKKPKPIKFIKAENLNDYRRQIDNAMAAHPGARIVAHEELTTDQKSEASVSESDLAKLAEVSGVPANVLQDFLDAGLGDYLATRGVRARFAGASKLPGFSHDMLRANASHAKQMTDAIMRLAHRAAMEERLKGMPAGDPLLKEYAERFVERIDTPIPAVAGTVRQITTLFYLGFNAVTALINASSSMVFAPAIAAMSSRSPLRGVKMMAQAAKRQADAVAHIFMKGKLTGVNQVEDAAKSYDKSNPALAKALREAEKAGVFADTFDREAEEVAKFGKQEGWGKVKENLSNAYMHFFSKVETANRLATFIGGYEMYEESKGHKAFDNFVDNLGFDGKDAADFGEFFSDFNNFRMDKTDMPSWAQGTFQKDEKGRTKFAPSVVRPMAYALKSWSFNYLQQQALVLRAALRGGFIDRALYGAIASSMIMAFGAVNMIPGGQSVDAVAKLFSRELKSPSEQIAETGTLGRSAMTGGLGALTNEVFGERIGKYVDQIAARTGPGNVIPTGMDSLIAPLGIATGLASSAEKIASGDTPRQLEGLAGLLGKEPGRLAETANMLSGNRGKTSKTGATVVPDEETALPGMPSLGVADMVAYGAGLTPPVVQSAYRLKQLNEDMKQSNDKFQARVVNEIADAYLSKQYDKVEKVMGEIQEWNDKAMREEQYYKVITGDGLKLSVQLELRSRLLGPADLRFVPKTGRPVYQKAVEDLIPDENKTVTE